MTEPWELTAAELATAYAAGASTPERALEAVLGRIEDVNTSLNAVITLDVVGARAAAAAAAARWREGRALGPIDGVPLTVKDNIHVGGLRATWGSRLFADFVAPCDDLPVARLRAAGAVIVGKTNTPELSLAGYTDNLVFGATGNPWAPELTPGGSSGGPVAAVAAGMGPLALATDAGGSIRRPAGHAGVTGLKPGLGQVPRRFGFPPLAHDLQVIGPVARCVADLRSMLVVIGPGAAPSLPAEPTPRTLRIGCFGAVGNEPLEPAVSAAFAAAIDVLRAQGHEIVPITALWDATEVNTLFAILTAAGVARIVAGVPDWERQVTAAIASIAETGLSMRAVDYVTALDRVAVLRAELRDAIATYDVIATPSSSALPWPKNEPYPTVIAGQPASPRSASVFSTAVNLAGLPAITVPAPVALGALPVGLQLIGSLNATDVLLDVAEQFERACPWRQIATHPT